MARLQCEIQSKAIKMATTLTIILPQDYHRSSPPPKVLYLLHGRSHNHSVWTRYTALEQYAQKYNLAVVMPEVNRSFYTNMALGVNYLSYIAEELPGLCHSMFHLAKGRENTFIAGMSMGGYGAVKCALTRPENYQLAGAFSGVSDIQYHMEMLPESDGKKNEFRSIFGVELTCGDDDDLFILAKKALSTPYIPSLYMCCGKEDHLHNENVAFKSYLESLSYPIVYEEWAGIHDWIFWDKAIKRFLDVITKRPL